MTPARVYVCIEMVRGRRDRGRRHRPFFKHRIDVDKAIRLYNSYRSWKAVAFRLRRPDGSRYQAESIMQAVRRRDKGRER